MQGWDGVVKLTSVYSVEPIRPNSSAPQLPKIMDLRGLHLPGAQDTMDLLKQPSQQQALFRLNLSFVKVSPQVGSLIPYIVNTI